MTDFFNEREILKGWASACAELEEAIMATRACYIRNFDPTPSQVRVFVNFLIRDARKTLLSSEVADQILSYSDEDFWKSPLGQEALDAYLRLSKLGEAQAYESNSDFVHLITLEELANRPRRGAPISPRSVLSFVGSEDCVALMEKIMTRHEIVYRAIKDPEFQGYSEAEQREILGPDKEYLDKYSHKRGPKMDYLYEAIWNEMCASTKYDCPSDVDSVKTQIQRDEGDPLMAVVELARFRARRRRKETP